MTGVVLKRLHDYDKNFCADLFINQRGASGRSPANPTFGNPAKPDFRFNQCFPKKYVYIKKTPVSGKWFRNWIFYNLFYFSDLSLSVFLL